MQFNSKQYTVCTLLVPMGSILYHHKYLAHLAIGSFSLFQQFLHKYINSQNYFNTSINNRVTLEHIKHRNKIWQVSNTKKFNKISHFCGCSDLYEYIWLSCIYSHFKCFQIHLACFKALKYFLVPITFGNLKIDVWSWMSPAIEYLSALGYSCKFSNSISSNLFCSHLTSW